jgi:hypothetical protein
MKTHKIHARLAADLPIGSQVVPAVIVDPYGTIPGEKITVLRSIRNDPLAGMRARDFIDECQYQAGRRWQFYLEGAQIGRVKAINPTKEAVSGVLLPEPLTDRSMQASQKLIEADAKLGPEGAALVRDVLGEAKTIKWAADRRGMQSQLERRYIGLRFRECLTTLAEIWGLRTGRTK